MDFKSVTVKFSLFSMVGMIQIDVSAAVSSEFTEE